MNKTISIKDYLCSFVGIEAQKAIKNKIRYEVSNNPYSVQWILLDNEIVFIQLHLWSIDNTIRITEHYCNLFKTNLKLDK